MSYRGRSLTAHCFGAAVESRVGFFLFFLLQKSLIGCRKCFDSALTTKASLPAVCDSVKKLFTAAVGVKHPAGNVTADGFQKEEVTSVSPRRLINHRRLNPL